MLGHPLHQLQRRSQALGLLHQFFLRQHGQPLHVADDGTHVPHRLHHVTGAGFAFGADHGRAFGDAPQGLAQVAAAADEGHAEELLVDVVFFIGRCQYFAFVDEVHLQRFQHLRFGKVADAHLGHHRDGDRLHDFADDFGRGHAGHAAFFANVSRHALQRHHRAAARLLGDASLLGVGDVHDDAAFEHFRQAYFHPPLLVLK